ncbi:hypothetical protein yc1106_09009 [Curvularia clavata]|uniref:Uncharacterized protein n=1 Tax=Curvularia clavata TaxID=95742 RepID=A0A9Q8ZGF5_CURCL|nr:hypothetical protein yc1106_09009 [Curvularia clavata]
MPTHRLSNPGSLDLGSHQDPADGANTARCDSQSAAMDPSEPANANPRTRSSHALHQDTLAYHKALGDISSSPPKVTSQSGRKPVSHGCIRHDSAGADDVQDYRDQQHARRQAVPINLAFRLGNRSNGVPLATIIEQGSYSTLESRSSLFNVGPFPSLRVLENISPSCASPKVSPCSDDHALQLITGSARQEQALDLTPRACYKPSYKDIGNLSPRGKTTIPSLQLILNHPQNIQHQSKEIGRDGNSTNAKEFVRGVLHQVRATARTRSKSSSTHTPITEYHEIQPEKSKDDLEGQASASGAFRSDNNSLERPPFEPIAPLSVTQLSALEQHQSRDARTLTADSGPSARLDFPSCKYPPPPPSSHAQLVVTPQPSKPTTATPKCQRSCSVLVDPEPQADLQKGCCREVSELPTYHENPAQIRSAFYSVSVPSNASLLLAENDCTRDASQNTSFCSTVSTSYSGTVVGVDVDLQHEFPHTVRHPRLTTPMAPVWFTPRIAEREEQGPVSGYSETKQEQETELPRRSITSAALTTLLPIAVASGIVRPNYETPKISFFSPSGNLIQPEECFTPSTTHTSDSGRAPSVKSKYNKPTPPHYRIFPVTCLPPPRPSLRPMITPPTTSVPLPPNLRHHHNYKRPEKAQINPETECVYSFITTGPAVKGCDGIVQTSTLPAYSQTHRSYEKIKARPQYRRHGPAESFKEDIRLEVRARQARMITAITASCTTTGKGRLLGKQNAATKHASMPHKRMCAGAVSTSGRKHLHTRYARRRHNTVLLGPVTGHVLRVCFCQPYDGAGKPTHDVSAKTFCMGGHASDMHENPNKESLPINVTKGAILDAVLPNARVVTGVNRKITITNSTRKRTRIRR